MKREILFRAKRVDNGEWVYGYYLFHVIKNKHIILTLGVSKFIEVIPETVGQFTGILDKNGKQIFEGDLLQIDRFKGVVVYSEKYCQYLVSGIVISFFKKEIEIIGNIHDK